MRWKKLNVTYLLLLIALAISLIFLTNQDLRTQPSATNVARTTTTSFLDHPPSANPQTTTTATSAPLTTTTTTFQASTYPDASFSSDVWDRLCACECGDVCDWSTDAFHDGGLQFHPDTWTDYVAAGKPYGLSGYPAHAYEASREQQITVAIRVRDGVKGSSDPYLNAQGWEAWPTCRHEVGV